LKMPLKTETKFSLTNCHRATAHGGLQHEDQKRWREACTEKLQTQKQDQVADGEISHGLENVGK
jgi:hypothetical protein